MLIRPEAITDGSRRDPGSISWYKEDSKDILLNIWKRVKSE